MNLVRQRYGFSRIQQRACVFIATIFLCLAAGEAAAQRQSLLEYPSIHSPKVGLQGMVVSQNEIASAVGARILAEGGNAFDAAVAVGFALAVTLPRAGNIGGDGFLTAYVASQRKVTTIDFRSVAPQTAQLEMFLDAKGEESESASVGYRAAAVPGTVAGLELAHKRYGKLAWAQLVAPAVALARDGVVLSADEAFVFGWGQKRLQASEAAQRTFFKADGSGYRAGERLQQADLAWTLDAIAKGGADAFYRGEIAARIEADMQRQGGLITRADLAAYRAIEREPLSTTYRGYTIYTAPPASGGITLLTMLNILENFEVAKLEPGSAEAVHLLAETMRLGNRDRIAHLGDTAFATVPLEGLVSKKYAADRAKLIKPRKAGKDSVIKAGNPADYESPSTTHYSVADSAGNWVSVTYTLGSDFGSGAMIEGTGILLNNQMNNFSHERARIALQRGEPLPPNAMQAGKRMVSTMTPTLVFRGDTPWMAVGTPGGGRIVNTILQVVVNAIDFKLNIDEAIHQPRVSQVSGALEIEPNYNPDTRKRLEKMGHKTRASETMGSVQAIVLENGYFFGGSDPRRPGAAAVAP
jgi:gamma-glutamyltranspeptidase/glutathione hydrolase